VPRIRRNPQERRSPRFPDLLAQLAQELTQSRESGQPVIEEQVFPRTQAVRVTVLWDAWEGVPDEDRAATILQAYEQAEGKEFRDRIALAIGLTIPEAVEAGLLPFQVTALLRKGDPVTPEQCRDAMTAQGGSTLEDPDRPLLRFATAEEAEACVRRLSQQLPGSEPVWTVTQDSRR
jgi:hypothetical protein